MAVEKEREVRFIYTFVNPELVFNAMKAAMKDCQRGSVTREECAEIIRNLCGRLTQGQQESVMSFPELQEYLQSHLAQNRRR